jgi:hypothetical protein
MVKVRPCWPLARGWRRVTNLGGNQLIVVCVYACCRRVAAVALPPSRRRCNVAAVALPPSRRRRPVAAVAVLVAATLVVIVATAVAAVAAAS